LFEPVPQALPLTRQAVHLYCAIVQSEKQLAIPALLVNPSGELEIARLRAVIGQSNPDLLR
jgi:hypothetical protein